LNNKKSKEVFAMKKVVIVFVIFSFLGLQLIGCASMSGTEKGAVAGASAGGILGAILGDTKGAVIGAFAGAIIGAVIGNYYDKQTASRAEAAKKYEYKDKEKKLEIEDAAVKPQDITPGAKVETTVLYSVLTPDAGQNVKITETRTLISGQERMELAKREVIRPQGTHLSTMKFTLPKDIEKGDYTLIITISDGKQTKTAKSPLRVV
jgi:mannitol-specific phosphotransferase system IIBC component